MFKRTKHTPDTGRTDGRTPDGQTLKVPDGRTLSGTVSGAPAWVGWFTDIGRPLSAITVMVLCAPGERHLAQLAGWGPTLSWGMAGLLVMYAGIAAVVATVRPKGAPGKQTAVLGAIVSLMLAMAAQPVSHYFVTGWMTDSPRAPFWLVTVVSCVPPFVMGHLLHLAADPGTGKAVPERVHVAADAVRTPQNGAQGSTGAEVGTDAGQAPEQAATEQQGDYYAPVPGTYRTLPDSDDGAGIPWGDAMRWAPEADSDGPDEMPVRPPLPVRPDNGTTGMVTLSALRNVRPATVSAWADSGQGETPDSVRALQDGILALAADSGRTDSGHDGVSAGTPDGRTAGQRTDSGRTADGQITGLPDAVRRLTRDLDRTAGQPDSRTADLSARTARADAGQMDAVEMSTFIRDTWSLNPDMTREDMRTVVRRSFPGKKADAVRKAVTRAEEAMGS
jgi:hypothetical protein